MVPRTAQETVSNIFSVTLATLALTGLAVGLVYRELTSDTGFGVVA